MFRSKLKIALPLVGLFVALIGVWFLMHKPMPTPSADELNTMVDRFGQSTPNDPNQIIDNLRSLDIQSQSIPEASFWAFRILTFERQMEVRHLWQSITEWEKKSETAPYHYMLVFWERHAQTNKNMRFILDLYEADYARTREVLHEIIGRTAPYPEVLLIEAAHDLLKVSLPDVWQPSELPLKNKETLRKLMSSPLLDKWLSTHQNLHRYSGETHTILGLYDWISYDGYRDATGFSDFPKTADVYYDVGGGFATPDISRVIGKPFTSLDIIAPADEGSLNLHFQIVKNWSAARMRQVASRPESAEEHESYIRKLKETPFMKFDVFKDNFPSNYQSYFITSFGFLSSTVSSASPLAPPKRKLNAYYYTTYSGLRSVMDLVAQGKDVSLFTYQRASARTYQFRTVFLKFHDHKLVLAKLWPPVEAGPQEAQIIDRIDAPIDAGP